VQRPGETSVTTLAGSARRARAIIGDDREEAERRVRARANRRASADLARSVRNMLRDQRFAARR
jgi:hypothetical protein